MGNFKTINEYLKTINLLAITTQNKKWTKEELTIYILLTCARADNLESEDEINMIKAKTDEGTFDSVYSEFTNDGEDKRLDKIDYNIIDTSFHL